MAWSEESGFLTHRLQEPMDQWMDGWMDGCGFLGGEPHDRRVQNE
jgi:hypothetical protein